MKESKVEEVIDVAPKGIGLAMGSCSNCFGCIRRVRNKYCIYYVGNRIGECINFFVEK